MITRRFLLLALSVALPLLSSALHNGQTHIEAGAWTIRNAVRSVCNKGQGRAGYRMCLATAVSHPDKHIAFMRKMDDRCAINYPGCGPFALHIPIVKNCFNTVSVVNKSLPYRPWHAELFEDIMVGCLSKENINRVVIFTREEPHFPYTQPMLESLLKGAVPERKDLQSRIVHMCTNFKN